MNEKLCIECDLVVLNVSQMLVDIYFWFCPTVATQSIV